jgi:hypothetical protein
MEVPGEKRMSPLWIVVRTPSKVTLVRAWTAKFPHT